MIVFEQSLSADGTDNSPRVKANRRSQLVRMRAPGNTGMRRELRGSQDNLGGDVAYVMEVERRMLFPGIETSTTRNDVSASTFPGYPRCNSIPS